MPHLSICLFGPFRVTLDGEPVASFESDKVRALLAYLCAAADVPHRREKLAGLLWGAWPDDAARANLSRALTNLRLVIGDRGTVPPFLLISRPAIQFNRVADTWVDVATFESNLQEAGAKGRDAESCFERLASAVQLYRGHFLEAFSLSGCPEFEEWVVFEGERLERRALQALDHLAGWHEQRGELELALHHAWRQVEIAPWLEGAQQRVMRLLARTGQRAAAIAQYESCRRYLAGELHVEPSGETEALYASIRRGTLAPARSPAPRHNLRAPLTPFVGRETELANLGERLRDPACRLLTLVGPGGIGKTRLAVEAARVHLGLFPDGVFQVRLVGLGSTEAIVPAIADAIGFSFRPQGDAKQQLLDYLSNKTMLLVLDNFEHLLDGLEIVIDLLQAAADIKAMITSRTRLRLQGEHLFLLEGLAEHDAVELFVGAARRACPALGLSEHGTRLRRICRLLDGMPLAILLAASSAGTLSLAEIEARVVQDLDLLEAGWRDVPERHRSLRASFDHSWRILAPREQELLQALSVFRGSFSHEAAGDIAGALSGELRLLIDKSFLHQLPTGRYEVHELLRQYAAEKLAGVPGSREMIHDRHSAHYLAAFQHWGEEMKGSRQQAALAEMEMALDNASAAWWWAAERRQVEHLGLALEGLCLFFEWCGRYREGEATCRLAAGKLAAEVSVPGLRLLSRLLAWQGAFDRLLERRDDAAQLFRKSERLLEHPALVGQDQRWERAFLLFQRGHLALHSDRIEAGKLHGQSTALFRAVGDAWWAAAALRDQGRAAFLRGAHGEAMRLQEESLAARRALGDQIGVADSLDRLGVLAMFQGELEQAEWLLRESVTTLREIGSRSDYVDALFNLSLSLATAGRLNEGHSMLEQVVAIDRDLGARYNLAEDRAFLGLVETWQGHYEQALTESGAAVNLAQEVGCWRGKGLAYWVRGAVAVARGAYPQAWQWAQESATLMRSIQQQDDLTYALAIMSLAACALGHRSQARQHVQEAMRMAADSGSFAIVVFALPAVARLLAEEGHHEHAVELYALVESQIALVPNSPWYGDIAGRAIAAVAAGLPPGVAAAARARGRARDLWTTVAELAEAWPA